LQTALDIVKTSILENWQITSGRINQFLQIHIHLHYPTVANDPSPSAIMKCAV